MKCQTILQKDLHENYLLNKLEKRIKADYKNHLNLCNACRKDLEKQKLILFGLQKIGKQEMKAEIRRQIEIQKMEKKQRSWNMVLKVAAVLLFFTLTPITLYYFNYIAIKSNSELLPIQINSTEGEVIYSPSPPQKQVDVTSGNGGTTSKKIEQPISVQNHKIESSSKKVIAEGTVFSEATGEDAERSLKLGEQEEDNNLFSMKDKVEEENIQMLKKHKSSRSLAREPQKRQIYRLISPQTSTINMQSETGGNELFLTNQEIQDGEQLITPLAQPEKKAVATSPRKLSKEEADKSFSGKSRIGSKIENDKPNTKVLHFLYEKEIIQVNLTLNEALENTSKKPFPDSFETQIISRETDFLEMNWQVNRQMYELNPLTFKLEKKNPAILVASLADSVTYEINLEPDASTARLSP